ncbi:MAG: hypothetical protein J0H78_16315 [Rhizobiales bacterium]|nr:hypothetical protein [Hyphomicrobiales bacterium]OJY45824.1 MAG: hypothetical protein BGP08_06360 [Rhizobiales bacterium 64-17]
MDERKYCHNPLTPLAFAAAIIAVTLLYSRSDGLSQSTSTTIAISRMDIGAPPREFEFARTGQGSSSRWTVVRDTDGLEGRVIEQSSTDQTDYRFPLAIFRPLATKNVTVSLRFKPLDGRIDRSGGIAIRVTDADNYYVVRANALEDNIRFYRVVDGRREQIASVDMNVSAGRWHVLGIKAEGERFAITFNGKTVITTSDNAISKAGKIALWTKADSVTRFDQIAIDVLPDKE